MTNKNIQYVNKDFGSFKTKLINFAKTYYPNTYNDFSETSPGMMLIEMASYVGDVLALYQDNQIQETFLQFSKQRKNLLSQAYVYGYKPQITSVANVGLEVYQLVPATTISGSIVPDFRYSILLEEGAQVQSSQNNSVKFYIESKIDFSVSSSTNPTDVSVYSLDGSDEPNFYLLKKSTKAYSGDIKTSTYSFTDPQRFSTVSISDDKIIKILDVYDSNDEEWKEVDYLGQETIFDKVPNQRNIELTQYEDEVPYLLRLKKVPKRFISRFKTDTDLEIQFGAGISDGADEEIIPNFENIGLGLPIGINKLDVAYDPSNFLYTKNYGIAPSDTTLTFRYLVGGGAEANVSSNTLQSLFTGSVSLPVQGLDGTISTTVLNSLSFNNDLPAVGGGAGDSNDELKLNILSTYPTQLRTVSVEDYLVRTLSLPAEFGLISKAHVNKNTENIDKNLFNIYILSKNANSNLEIANRALKLNLQTYLNEYRLLTDAINIKDAFIINIGLNFDITLRPNFNNRTVINNCLTVLKDYFNVDKWRINQPIILSEIYTLLDRVEGVQTVKKIEIVNKSGVDNGYSKYGYDIKGATVNDVIYPSLDPSVFELKYPNTDIQGRSVTF